MIGCMIRAEVAHDFMKRAKRAKTLPPSLL